jgi:hypothetical protein
MLSLALINLSLAYVLQISSNKHDINSVAFDKVQRIPIEVTYW